MASAREILSHRVPQRIAELGTNARAVSMGATGKPDTIRDMLRRRSMPNAETLERLAEELQTTTDWLLGKTDVSAQVLAEATLRDVPTGFRGFLSQDLPVLGTGFCDDLIIEDADDSRISIERALLEVDHTIRMISRPAALTGAKDAYAIYCQGSSMEHRFYQGDLAIVDPRRPPSPGDFVVAQLNDGNDDTVVTVLVKQLVRSAGSYVEFRQLNPELTFRIPRQQVSRLHRILTNNELFT